MSFKGQFYVAPLGAITMDVNGTPVIDYEKFEPLDNLVDVSLGCEDYTHIQGRKIEYELPWGIKRKE